MGVKEATNTLAKNETLNMTHPAEEKSNWVMVHKDRKWPNGAGKVMDKFQGIVDKIWIVDQPTYHTYGLFVFIYLHTYETKKVNNDNHSNHF
jgi:hypothetical protein